MHYALAATWSTLLVDYFTERILAETAEDGSSDADAEADKDKGGYKDEDEDGEEVSTDNFFNSPSSKALKLAV